MNERIKKLRGDLKLGIQQFGEELGYSKSYISMVESGKRAVSEDLIKRIAQKFSINEEWLRSGKGGMYKTAPILSAHYLDDMTVNYAKAALEPLKPFTDLLFYRRGHTDEPAPTFDAVTYFSLDSITPEEEPIELLRRLHEMFREAENLANTLDKMLFSEGQDADSLYEGLREVKEEIDGLIAMYQENAEILEKYMETHDTNEKILNIEERVKSVCNGLHWKEQIKLLHRLEDSLLE